MLCTAAKHGGGWGLVELVWCGNMADVSPTPFWSKQLPMPELPLPQTVAGDLSCRRCSYNLRTLLATGVCPECGTPVALSMSPDRLRFADPEWLGTVRRGNWVLVAGLVASIFLGYVRFPWLGLPVRTSDPLFNFASFVLIAVGSFFLTVPDPSESADSGVHSLRWAARVLVGMTAGVWLAIRLVISFWSPVPIAPLMILNTLSDLFYAAFYLALLRYLGRIIRRVPEVNFSRRLGALSTGLAIALGVRALLRIMMRFTAGKVPTSYLVLIGVELDALIYTVLKIVLIGLLYQFGGILKEELLASRVIWSAGEDN
jgi:hypothetical protein